ncbi:MAG TPA: biopolymer transporter ExbD [Steroidobacteraceae bacterium]|nr:biopolymer transporter ExbD [Steroidobacteraceae bacterium]
MYDSHLRRARKPAELLLVPMIDIFTVLVTFLLMTAVFARITVLQLDLPSAADSNAAAPTFRLEVIVRKEGLELTNGTTQIAALPTINGEYDLKTLSDLALSLKRSNPSVDSASVLMEPDVEYDNLIQVMDAIRSREMPPASLSGEVGTEDQQIADESGDAQPTRVALFTRIAVGDAP